ncbi:MAG: AI-2E family transporter, partial [Oscillospiraceae bacterium]
TKRTLGNLVVVCIGILLYLALANFRAITEVAARLYGIISPFIAGVALAYLLNMPMRFFENRLFARLRRKRGAALVTTYVVALLVVALLIGLVVPQLVESVMTLASNLSQYLNNLNELVAWLGARFEIEEELLTSLTVTYTDILRQVVDIMRSLPNLVNIGMQIGSGVIGALTAVIASIYMLASKEKLLTQTRRVLYALLPKRGADGLMRIGQLSNGVFSGFIGGKILDSAIIGAICFVFMSVANLFIEMPYTLLISIIIGVTNVIPFFGPFIGAIPSIMILLVMNPWSALWFTIFIIVLQQFDGNVLGPKILGNSTGLPAMWVLVAIVVGGGLFGFAGMLLGVPTAAVLYTLASDLIERRLQKKNMGKQGKGDVQGEVAEAEPAADAPPDVADAPPPQGPEGE